MEEKFRAQAGLLQMLEQDLKELRDEHVRLESEAGRQFEALERFNPPSPPVSLDAVLAAVRSLLPAALPKEVLSKLTEEASSMGVRAALFEVRGKCAWAVSAHGFEPPLTEKVLRTLVVPLTVNSPFRELFETGRCFKGDSAGLKKNSNVLNRFRPDERDSILLLPIYSGGVVSAIFYADSGGSGAPLPENALSLLAEFAGARLDRLMAPAVRPRTAVVRDVAERAQTEFAPVLEPSVATLPPRVIAGSIEDHGAGSEPYVLDDDESKVVPLPDRAIEPTAPVDAALADEPAELPSAAASEASAPSLEELHANPPVTPAIESAGPVEATTAEVAADLPVESGMEAVPSSQEEPVVAPPVPQVLEYAAIAEAPAAASQVELPTASGSETGAIIYEEPSPQTAAALLATAPAEQVSEEQAVARGAALPSMETVPSTAVVSESASKEIQEEVGGAPNPAASEELETSRSSEAEEKARHAARRLAKLLVYEIELYNKIQAAEGRKSKDLYRRLKRDIELSRLTFDRRFGKTAGKQFDFFHDELVRTLAGDDPSLLGPDYPGPSM